jgi:hypothetical protein
MASGIEEEEGAENSPAHRPYFPYHKGHGEEMRCPIRLSRTPSAAYESN